LDRRAFPGAVRTRVGDDLAAPNDQIDASQRLDDTDTGPQQVAKPVAQARGADPLTVDLVHAVQLNDDVRSRDSGSIRCGWRGGVHVEKSRWRTSRTPGRRPAKPKQCSRLAARYPAVRATDTTLPVRQARLSPG